MANLPSPIQVCTAPQEDRLGEEMFKQHEACIKKKFTADTPNLEFGIQNKAKTVLGAHPTPAMQQDTETSSAGQPSP